MRAEKLKTQLIDEVVRYVGERIERKRAPLIENFIRQFYAYVPQSDIAGDSAEDLFSAALSLANFAQVRAAGQAKVRVFNPRIDEHGWRSPHTVVEIVNDDMPFLVDSLTAEMNRQDIGVHLVIHPIMRVTRDAKGQLTAIGADDGEPESVMQLRVNQVATQEQLDALKVRVEIVLRDVRLAVTDWQAMRAKMTAAIEETQKRKLPLPAEEIAEVTAFLRWINDDHFTFLGYREYSFAGKKENITYHINKDAGLGLLRDPDVRVFEGMRNLDALPPDVRNFLAQPQLTLVTKANLRSTVHRNVHLDTVGIKIFNDKGEVTGEHLFAGLFTSIAYNRSPWEIPLLRHKVETVVKRAGFTAQSHDGKALAHILETYPRDELFQTDVDGLLETSLGILNLQDRQRVALFIRRDPYERFLSCFVYLPRDWLTTDLRHRINDILCRQFNGRLANFFVHVTDSPLARYHVIIATKPGEIPSYDAKEIERLVADACRSWKDKLKDALVESKGEAEGLNLLRLYGDAFPVGFEEYFNANAAVNDIERVEEALKKNHTAISLYRPIEAAENELHLKLYKSGDKIALSNVLPSLENFGLKVISENPFDIRPQGQEQPIWIHAFTMVTADGRDVDIAAIRDKFHEAYAKIWDGQMEDDGFNRLVITAGLGWRDITLVRAYCKYLRQAAIAFSQAYMEATLNANPGITRNILQLFHVRNDPSFGEKRDEKSLQIVEKIGQKLDAVVNLDEDRILRRYLNAVQCTLRTNFYQPAAEGGPKEYVSFKLDSHKIEELPLPRPMVEVFVYSPRAEAIHLRGGKVARGGIRWSDRREDFRTEILGLMKAQMVKNAVIVPVGSKGGFVVKRPAQGDRDAVMAEVVHCYKTLMRGLLDITDNLVGGAVKPPAKVVRHDGDDPYLVVAADKGTATFSDIANSVSRDYGFWLDDAFASGGSAGYDHKKMGITARGAWECVKRHFRELDHDIQNVDFSCVGVGDMSGDVFGNGMLLSEHTKLIAAFNHMHIFLDPSPDVKKSFAERQRLFNLPRSAWSDYDTKLISAGGGVFDRKAKSIKLSAEVKQRFGFTQDQVTPNELIQLLLKSEVDLLFFGGIGTYVKSSDETHADVGDRANDAVRVNAEEVRARVIGEGANLGCTQRGRIEAAMTGKRLNTDAVDNSAGVDTSDHEVNIKILINEAVAAGDLTLKQRDKLLAEMTDEVGQLVLRDNYLQSQALSVAEAQSYTLLDQQNRFMRGLERAGRLDRGIEFLPDDETMRHRVTQRIGMTRSESAVLLAYSKMALYDELLPSDLPDDPQLADDLITYFPKKLQEGYQPLIHKHRLRREIISTVVTNSLVNRMGATFVHVTKEKTGQSASAITRAYAITRGAFKLRDMWSAIQALDNKVSASVQTSMLIEINRLAEQATLWFLRNCEHPLDIAGNIAGAAPGIAAIEAALPKIISASDQAANAKRQGALQSAGVPEALARRISQLGSLATILDVVKIAAQTKIKVEDVAATYFAIGDQFNIDWLRSGAKGLIGDSHWQRLAVFAIIDDLNTHQRDLTASVLANDLAQTGEKAIDGWKSGRTAALPRAEALFADLKQVGKLELAMLAVANRALRSLLD